MLAGAATLVAPGPSRALPQAATCSGVWVVVDFGTLGGVSTRCATSYSSGAAALSSAGFAIGRKSGMICTIESLPNPCAITTSAYWSYWHAKKRSDGSYGGWTYSNLGADAYNPVKGDAEGWRFGNGKSAPGAAPPRATTPSPKPTVSRTTTKAAPKPASTPTRATTRPKVTTKASSKPSATVKKTPTPTPTPSPVTRTSEVPVAAATETAPTSTTATPEPGSPGSPVGALATIGVLVAGGAGLGGWWLLKGRRP
jgi:hypothetical protein